MDFGQAVEIYKQNYVQYKTTGRVEYKTAYETADSWIQQYLENMQSRIQDGSKAVTSFVNQNVNTGTELGQLQSKMKTVRTEGPKSQDAYITVKRINAQQPPEDNADLYVKAGIAAGLAGIAFVMSVV